LYLLICTHYKQKIQRVINFLIHSFCEIFLDKIIYLVK
jgi:hypothetical protein